MPRILQRGGGPRHAGGEPDPLEYAEPDYVVQALDTTPSDPYFLSLQGLEPSTPADETGRPPRGIRRVVQSTPLLRLRLAGAVVALGAIACAAPPSLPAAQPSSTAVREDVRAYVDSAPQLSPEQAQAMLDGRPFEGMTLPEATLAMQLLETSVVRDGMTLSAVFLGGDGRRYYVDFQGDPARIAFFSLFGPDEIRLRDSDELHPEPPIPFLRR